MSIRFSCSMLAVSLLLLPSLGAQRDYRDTGSPELTSKGPFLGAGMAMVAGSGTRIASGTMSVPVPRRQIGVKKPGFRTPQPASGTPMLSGHPIFTWDAILRNCAGTAPANIFIGSMSLGLNVIPANNTGRIDFGTATEPWAIILFSLDRGTPATGSFAPTNPVLLSEAMSGDIGADVFSYVVPGSTLHSSLVDETERVLDGVEIGWSDPTATNPWMGEITAMDPYISLYSNPDMATLLSLPAHPALFFTVSKESIDAVPNFVPPCWFGTTTPSAATVLVTTWNGTSWTMPHPLMGWDYSTYGLGAADEIDALAVDGQGQKLIFSYAGDRPGESQLRLLCWGTDDGVTYIGNLMDPTGCDLTDPKNMGSEKAPIQSVCIIDPSKFGGGAGGQTGFEPFAYASPADPVFALPVTLSASAFRGCDAGGNPALQCFMTGWPPSKRAPGYASLWFNLAGGAVVMTPWQTVPRDPGDEFGGNPIEIDVPIPPPYSSLIFGFELRGQWFALTFPPVSPANDLAVSLPFDILF